METIASCRSGLRLQFMYEIYYSFPQGLKEYCTKAVDVAKEAEALAEARANSEARTDEGRLREAEEREAMLVQALEELWQALSRQEQQQLLRKRCHIEKLRTFRNVIRRVSDGVRNLFYNFLNSPDLFYDKLKPCRRHLRRGLKLGLL